MVPSDTKCKNKHKLRQTQTNYNTYTDTFSITSTEHNAAIQHPIRKWVVSPFYSRVLVF